MDFNTHVGPLSPALPLIQVDAPRSLRHDPWSSPGAHEPPGRRPGHRFGAALPGDASAGGLHVRRGAHGADVDSAKGRRPRFGVVGMGN